MFVSTILLSACVLSHNEGQSDGIVYPLNDGVIPRRITADRLGLRAPKLGGLGDPCRNTPGDECDWGLKCHHWTPDGTSIAGRCVRRYNPIETGGLNEPCNAAPEAPCNYDALEGVWTFNTCTCRPSTPPPSPRTGEANERCNSFGAPCNHANLQPHWSQPISTSALQTCTCVYLLGSTNEGSQETFNGDDQSSVKLGRSHSTGDAGQKCNTGRYESPCNCHREPCNVKPVHDEHGCTCHAWVGDASPALGRSHKSKTGDAGQPCNTSIYESLCNCHTEPCNVVAVHNDGKCTCEQEVLGAMLGRGHSNKPSTGDAGQPCNTSIYESKCNCHREPCNVVPVEHDGKCMCEQEVLGSSAPALGKSHTGDAGQACNTGRYESPCNCHREPCDVVPVMNGASCRCEQPVLGASESEQRLGMGTPDMGREGEPCRNTQGNECDYGLRCHYYTRDGTSTMGRCVRDYHPHHATGGLNQQCNRAPLSPCNTDDLKGVWTSGGHCMCRQHHSGNPRGEANGRCNQAPLAPCNHDNLQAHWVRLYPNGESCTCVYLLGSTNQGEGDESNGVTKLGMRAPEMGGEGEPCFNTPGHECNNGMYCKYTNHGSWTSGVCLKQYMPEFGKLGQPCDDGSCDTGLHCKVTWHGTFSTNVCEVQQVSRGHEGEQCNLLGSNLPECLDSKDFCKEVHLLPSGTTHICTRRTAGLGAPCGSYARKITTFLPTECDTGLVCKFANPTGDAQICEEPQHQGGANEPCRDNVFDPCDGDLVCNYFAAGTPECIYWLGNDGAAAAPSGN